MKKKYYFIVFGIIVILLVSMFVYLSKENSNAPDSNLPTNEPVIDDTIYPNSTASPSPTAQTIAPSPTATHDFGGNYNPNQVTPESTAAPIEPLGPIGRAQNVTSAVWRTIATNAWQYYQPNVGIDPTTGIPQAVIGFPYITDWDVGVYIQAIIDAQKIGVLSKDGAWGADDRIEKMLSFLETRQLNSINLPYRWYKSDGSSVPNAWWEDPSNTQTGAGEFDLTDAGRLLLALSNLKAYNPALTQRIDNVTKVRPDYSVAISRINATDNGLYGYIVAHGFAAFWPSMSNYTDSILDSIMSGPPVDVNGVKLPKAPISCDPLFIALFDLPKPDQRLINLSRQVYLAHEARYASTKEAHPNTYVAFGEGNSGYGDTFIYEWVVTPRGRTWKVLDSNEQEYPRVTSNVYTKISFSFLSVYKTEYARNAAIFVENNTPQPKNGYFDGINNSDPTDLRLVDEVGTNTNGLILENGA